MIRNDLYADALHRLRELEDMKVMFVSDGTPGGDKVASLVTFAQSVLPDLIDALEAWFMVETVSPELEQIRFKMAMDILATPVDQGMLHMMESMRRAIE